MKNDKKLAHIPVIMLTAKTSEEDLIPNGSISANDRKRAAFLLPVSGSDKSVRLVNVLEGVLLIDRVYPFNNERVYEDCKYMGWIK